MKNKLKTKEAIITLQSQKEFDRLLEFLESRGICWGSNVKPTARKDYYPIWGIYLHNNCIICAHENEEIYGEYKGVTHYTVDEFIKENSIMRDKFTKNDLESGMVVRARCGYLYIYLNYGRYETFVRDCGHMDVSDYLDDLTIHSHGTDSFDIMEVYKFSDTMRSLDFARQIKSGYLELIWKREEKPVEMTIAEIEERLGIKNLKVVKEKKDE